MRNSCLSLGLYLLVATIEIACLKPALQKQLPQTATTVHTPAARVSTVSIPASLAAAPRAALPAYVVDCDHALIDLSGPLQQIADSLTALKLTYSRRQLADCSGIYHRIVQALKGRCPHFVAPAIEQARSAAAIARWYAERRELIVIDDPLAQADLIKPGAVMFYARDQRLRRRSEPAQLFKAISHLGIVIAVTRDADGRVVSYQLFHGRTPGKTAAITNFHERRPARPTWPSFGNGKQPWVAMARLVYASSF